MKKTGEVTVAELREKRNEIDAKIASIEKKITDKNIIKLIEEISNLLDGVGGGFVEGDHFADTRYYSDIPGVKNIRFGHDNTIYVKIMDDSGYLIPEEVEVREVKYEIIFHESMKYADSCSY